MSIFKNPELCPNCVHKDVCMYKKDYAKFVADLEKDDQLLPAGVDFIEPLVVTCKYYWLSSSIDTAALFARTDGGSVHIFTVQAPNRASRRSEGFAHSTAVAASIAPTYRPLTDNIEYRLTQVQSLTFGFPAGNFECWVRLETATSGSISVTFPETAKFIGKAPSFGVGETWELSIKDNVVIALKVPA